MLYVDVYDSEGPAMGLVFCSKAGYGFESSMSCMRWDDVQNQTDKPGITRLTSCG